MRFLGLIFVVSIGAGSQANVQFYNSPDFASNGATRSSWLSDLGISAGDTLVDFESYTVGQNLHNVDLGGVTVTHPGSSALVQSSSSWFGTSNPIDTKALAMIESGGSIALTFATPVMYAGGFDIDKPGSTIKITLSDDSNYSFSHDSTTSSGNSAEFWGVRSLVPTLGITKVELIGTTGGDTEWGLDNLEFGGEPVPEPATMAALALGLVAVAKRRKRS